MKIKLFINKVLKVPNYFFIGLVWFYQKTLSPLLGPRCRYWPSCSTYTLESLKTHNIFKALILSSWRIVRCNPFTEGGLDPVPDKGKWLPSIKTDGSPRA
ncbi:MAG: membrane protein insertion efficiency factor YidD [Candidatus Nanopelagicales bacterium]